MTTPDPAAKLAAAVDAAENWHSGVRVELSSLDRDVRDRTDDKGLLAPWQHFVRGIRRHLDEEETILFPALRAVAAGKAPTQKGWRGLLDEMEQELDEIQTISDALRSAARDAGDLEQRILDLLDGLEGHAEKEQNLLLPLARDLVDGVPDAADTAEETEGPGDFATQNARPGGQIDVGLGRGGYAPRDRGLRATARKILGVLRG